MTGIDGLTFLNGVLYYNSVFFNNLYRVPVDAQGKAGTPVQIWMDAPVKGPDGMRAAGDQLFHAENGAGKIDMLTIDGDRAHVTVLKEGLSHADRGRAGRRRALDRQARHRQGRLDPDAEVVALDLRLATARSVPRTCAARRLAACPANCQAAELFFAEGP